MTADQSGNLLTAKQIAQVLGVKLSWVYAKTRKGILPHYDLDKYYRYDLQVVLESLKAVKIKNDSSFPGK